MTARTFRDRMQSDMESARENYLLSLQNTVTAERLVSDLLDLSTEFYGWCGSNSYGYYFHVHDNGVSAKLKDALAASPVDADRIAELRAKVADFNRLVGDVMARCGVDTIRKEKNGTDMRAKFFVYADPDDPYSKRVLFQFTWERGAPPCRKLRVTETREIEVCGDFDESKYDRVEEIAA